MRVEIKKLNDDAMLPFRGSDQAAGYDLYSCYGYVVPPNSTVKVKTGISAAIPDGYFGGIFARSGLATKHGLRPANCVGVIDSDYRGEIIVALHNDSEEEQEITKHTRVAQLVILPYLHVDFEEVNELDETERGEGGFGHTGV